MFSSTRYIAVLTIFLTVSAAFATDDDAHSGVQERLDAAKRTLATPQAGPDHAQKILGDAISDETSFGVLTREQFNQLMELARTGKCETFLTPIQVPDLTCHELLVRSLRHAGYLKDKTVADTGELARAIVTSMPVLDLHPDLAANLQEAFAKELKPFIQQLLPDDQARALTAGTAEELNNLALQLKYGPTGDSQRNAANALVSKLHQAGLFHVMGTDTDFGHNRPVILALGLDKPDQFLAFAEMMRAADEHQLLSAAPLDAEPLEAEAPLAPTTPDTGKAPSPPPGPLSKNDASTTPDGSPVGKEPGGALNDPAQIQGGQGPGGNGPQGDGSLFGGDQNNLANNPLQGLPGFGGGRLGGGPGGGGSGSGGGGGGGLPQGGGGSGGQYNKNQTPPPEVPKFPEVRGAPAFRMADAPQDPKLEGLAAQFAALGNIQANPEGAYKALVEDMNKNGVTQIQTFGEYAKILRNRGSSWLSTIRRSPLATRGTALSSGRYSRISSGSTRLPAALAGRPPRTGLRGVGGTQPPASARRNGIVNQLGIAPGGTRR